MKKILLAILLLVAFSVLYIFMNKLYYPPLPIDTLSKKEVVQAIKNADEKIVALTVEDGKQWFIVNERNKTIVDDLIINMIQEYGWTFKTKEGSGLFFERENSHLIVKTKQWTGNYSIVDIPLHFK